MSTTIFTSCNQAYEPFALPHILGALQHNDDVVVEVCVERPDLFKQENKQALEIIDEFFPDRSLIRAGTFNGVLANSVRFLEEPLLRSEYTYISDIDILILAGDLTHMHLDNMEKTGLPYSNILRPNSQRLTGLHFTRTQAHYPLVVPSDVDLNDRDEHLLYRLVLSKGLPLPDVADRFRPVPGFHLSLNRSPVTAAGVHKWSLPSAFLENYLNLVNSAPWQQVSPHFSFAFRALLLPLNTVLQSRNPDRAIFDPREATEVFTGIGSLESVFRAGEVNPTPEAQEKEADALFAERQFLPANDPESTGLSANPQPTPSSTLPSAAGKQKNPSAVDLRDTREDEARTDASPLAATFTVIYNENRWQGTSRSGVGSSQAATKLLREQLTQVFDELQIRVLCDAACGDASWITEITSGLDAYFGFDIVENLIQENRLRYPQANHYFQTLDISEQVLPRADAIICRDCLVHLPLDTAAKVIRNFKQSGSKYLLATTFPSQEANRQARIGTWRPLNMMAPPFSFPPSIRLLRERPPNPKARHNDKSLGLWLLEDL